MDDLEVAQFIYRLLNNQKLRNVIDTLAKRAVLILGRFGEHIPMLQQTQDALRHHGFFFDPV
ncbi:MAG: hypothetical protein H0X24_06595 [Ktedonobacterales bacterium]|nr:hypothetical protein [Ktedonobacterales bacterium]